MVANKSVSLSGPVLVIGGVIAIALVAIAVMMFTGEMRDQHGWGNASCHATYGDPGFGNVWEVTTFGNCRKVPW